MNEKRIKELQEIIAKAKAELEDLDYYQKLKSASPPKKFGEMSEHFVCENCSGFERKNQKGWDLLSEALGKVEVKSSRYPATTMNQCHPNDCDYFLFVVYHCDERTQDLWLMPSKDFMKLEPTAQHDRDEVAPTCFNFKLETKKRLALLEDYQVPDFEMLNEIATDGFDF